MLFIDNDLSVWVGPVQFEIDFTPISDLDLYASWGEQAVKGNVEGATNASPIVITSEDHGLENGDLVLVSQVKGNLGANGVWTVANKTDDTFELEDSTGTDAYVAGSGKWWKGVPGATELPAVYVDSKPGWYVAELSGAAPIVANRGYHLVVDAANTHYRIEQDHVAVVRR